METTFKNKVAIGTGVTSGIARAPALAFPKKGAKVVIVDWIKNNETLNFIKDSSDEAILIKTIASCIPMK